MEPQNIPVAGAPRAFTPRLLLLIGTIVFIVIILVVVLSLSNTKPAKQASDPLSQNTPAPTDPFAEVLLKSDEFEACFSGVEIALTTEDYERVMTDSMACRRYSLAYSQALERIDSSMLTLKQRDELGARRLQPSIMDNLLDAFYHVANGLKSAEQGDYTALSDGIEGFVDSLNDALYYIYRTKTEYPDYYYDQTIGSGMTETEFLFGLSTIYQLRNELASLSVNNTYFTYFYNVDALDSTVVYVTDPLVEEYFTEDERTLMLLDFVRQNVKYNFDPNWYQDWPMPPAYTLLSERGDCDDMSILLISMLKRAGVSNAELCVADSTAPYDDGYDHMVVGLNAGDGWYILDATCSTCEGIAPEDAQYWAIECAGVEDFLLSIYEA